MVTRRVARWFRATGGAIRIGIIITGGVAVTTVGVVTTVVASGGGGGLTCPAFPALPDANCTGWQHTGVTLTAYTGPSLIDVSGTTIDSKDIGCLTIEANNVTITRSRITCMTGSPTTGGGFAVYAPFQEGVFSGLTITDTEITRPAGGTGGLDYGIEFTGQTGLTLTRDNIHNLTSGVHLSGASNVTIQDSYFHDLRNISGSDHNDGVISNGGASSVRLLHNNIQVQLGETTPIAMYPEGSPNTFWGIEQNLLNGGGFCIYPSYTPGAESPNNHITVQDNHFGKLFYPRCGGFGTVNSGPNGASFFDGAGNIWTGNVWDTDGTPVSP